MSFLVFIITCCIIVRSQSDAARILAVFPIPSISHQVVFRPLTQELAKRGHDVTVITPDPAFPKGGTPPNLTEIDVHDISYNIWGEKFMKASKGNKEDIITQIDVFLQSIVSIFDVQLKDNEVQKLINDDKNNKFDLLFLEACVRPALAFSHIYKAPVILVSSFGASLNNYDTIGVPTHPILYPSIIRQRLHNLTIWEKMTEIYLHFRAEKMIESSIALEDNMLRTHFGPNIPSIAELSNNVGMLFLNANPVFEGIRPVPPSVVYMGGLHQKPDKALPKDLKSYLDSSNNGVIYISFGTNVDPTLLPPEKIQILVRVFSKTPYDVLWKWNEDELPGRTKNIRISKWLPQSDLLKHPKVKLFVTQGGLQSTDEAITAGVPLIGVPMLGDQWYNVEKYEYHKIGLKLDMETLTEETFRDAINTVIGDESYRRNIGRLRSMMSDELQSPLERAVWWTEHVLRHGSAGHLRAPTANISWSQYLELELVLTLLIGFLTITTIFITLMRALYKLVFTDYVSGDKIKRS